MIICYSNNPCLITTVPMYIKKTWSIGQNTLKLNSAIISIERWTFNTQLDMRFERRIDNVRCLLQDKEIEILIYIVNITTWVNKGCIRLNIST